MQRKIPAAHADELMERPTPLIKRPAANRKSQLSMKMKMTSHRAIGIEVRPVRLTMRTCRQGKLESGPQLVPATYLHEAGLSSGQ